ncbi:MAG: hypothetical protein JNK78_06300 [Planctomycetes bacterium]|nr:hypothetical protein [Planctomycetota bacterium]
MKPERRGAIARSRRSTGLLVTVVLVFGALVAFGVQQWRASAAASAVRADLLSRIDAATRKAAVDGNELSQLVAQLHKLPDHETARDLLAAQARIELARGRPERAFEVFGNQALQPGATAAEQSLVARILLRMEAPGRADAVAEQSLLKQALSAAESAYATTQDPEDAFGAWLAASRLSDPDASARTLDVLRSRHESSPLAKFAALAAKFDPERDGAELADLAADVPPQLPEVDAMQLLVVLQRGDLESAAAAAEQALGRGAGVTAVRWAAALAFHASALSHAAGTPGRTAWLGRRDTQLDWMLSRSPEADPRRERWRALKSLR